MPDRKRSVQRETILNILRSTDSHPSADWIYGEARKILPNISLGTVYRNLALLERSGSILKLDIGGGCDRFDGDISPHYHFVCERCGRIFDLPHSYQAELDHLAQGRHCGTVSYHTLCFHGLCRDCSDSGAAPNQNEKE